MSIRANENHDSSDVHGGFSTNFDLDRSRRAALEEVDNAKFSWFHAKVCLVTSIGFFTDSYDIFAINIASTILGYVYGVNGSLNANQDLGVKVATLVGNFCGQLIFGWLADLVGRKKMYGVELIIMIIATFAQALSGQAASVNIIAALIVWRFILGVGIGGDYPLSCVISSEFASVKIRGRLLTIVVGAQGWGNFGAALVALIVTTAYKDAILSSPTLTHVDNLDPTWRLLIGFGCVPGVAALYFRLTIPETPRFTMDVERNILQASADIRAVMEGRRGKKDEGTVVRRVDVPRATWTDFVRHFSKWQNGKILFGTVYSWLALDIAFYGFNLNSSIVLEAIGFGTPVTKGTQGIYDNLVNICVGNLILAAAGLIPGYYATFLLVDTWGRKSIQMMGFAVLTVVFAVMGFAYDRLTATPSATKAFVFLYCITGFFENFGPNSITFIVPGEVFPTRYRSTCHGISAASGKLGAIIAQVGFSSLKDIGGKNHFVKHIFEIVALFMLTGCLSTLLLPQTKNKTLEELSNEDQEGFVRDVPNPARG